MVEIRKKGRGFGNSKSELKDMEIDKFDTVDADAHGNYLKSVEGWILFITGVHEEAQEDTIIDKFSEYGQVMNIHLNLDRRTGYVKGYCLIEYATYEEAKQAKAEMDGKTLYDQKINVDFAFLRHPLTNVRE